MKKILFALVLLLTLGCSKEDSIYTCEIVNSTGIDWHEAYEILYKNASDATGTELVVRLTIPAEASFTIQTNIHAQFLTIHARTSLGEAILSKRLPFADVVTVSADDLVLP